MPLEKVSKRYTKQTSKMHMSVRCSVTLLDVLQVTLYPIKKGKTSLLAVQQWAQMHAKVVMHALLVKSHLLTNHYMRVYTLI